MTRNGRSRHSAFWPSKLPELRSRWRAGIRSNITGNSALTSGQISRTKKVQPTKSQTFRRDFSCQLALQRAETGAG
eukprot:794008-Pyramimonas_sp.AAC.1